MTTHTPIRSVFSGMVAQSGTIVLLNPGAYPSFSSYGNETWVWNGTNGNEDWTNVSTAFINSTAPLGPSVNGVVMSARINQAMAFDGTNVMVYGGQGSSSTAGVFQDTWTFNGTAWTLHNALSVIPFGRTGAVAAYVDGYGSVMFGGKNANSLLEETWLWSGSAWTQVSTPVVPAARTGHAMAGSPTAASVLMFGGQGTNSQFSDTWTFNGTTWTQVFPATVPSVRSGACMAYDSHNNIWVMFGGMNEYNFLEETWTFNGTTWTKIAVANGAGPAGCIGAQMAFDTTNNLTIMYGGIEAGGMYPSNATWSFNGTTWAKL
jgi:N-acetylneuraminic acid mutarotase